jgi:2-polyprenyl-3-methyl-5-hydroxy-6-metoxy-1,4-benzoquinol methylase
VADDSILATSPTCPCCGQDSSEQFYQVRSVPVHQVKLVRSRADALATRKGDIGLRFCHGCGFVWNAAFDPHLMQYEQDYESTQAVSPTFNRFHDRLARTLVERFELRGKTVVEMGCGQGEFVAMLAEFGANRGYGFDQVVRDEGTHGKVTMVKDLYGPRHSDLKPDFVACKMTLEHVHDTAAFIRSIRTTLGDQSQALVFFMIPEITRILELRAFWDVYYEHCSYFSPGSLGRLFRHVGFDPVDVWADYDDQYVLIAARPGPGTGPWLPREHGPETLAPKVVTFTREVAADQVRWRRWLEDLQAAGKKAVLWGGGSKGVAFLTTLGVTDAVEYAVDVNPRRAGTFIAGGGQQIVGPAFLADYQPDVVLIMSPIYTGEIRAELDKMGLKPALLTVETPPEAQQAA